MAVARGDAGFAVRGYAIMKRGYLFIALATLFFSTMEIALKEVAGLFNPVQLNLTRPCPHPVRQADAQEARCPDRRLEPR